MRAAATLLPQLPRLNACQSRVAGGRRTPARMGADGQLFVKRPDPAPAGAVVGRGPGPRRRLPSEATIDFIRTGFQGGYRTASSGREGGPPSESETDEIYSDGGGGYERPPHPFRLLRSLPPLSLASPRSLRDHRPRRAGEGQGATVATVAGLAASATARKPPPACAASLAAPGRGWAERSSDRGRRPLPLCRPPSVAPCRLEGRDYGRARGPHTPLGI